MRAIFIFLFIAVVICNDSPVQAENKMMQFILPAPYAQKQITGDMHISRGGQLYDNWWRTTLDTEKPEEDHPLWKTQKTNKRSGYSTYRCKECHGWDYLGKAGAYSKGSHFTGFIGVSEASRKMSVGELEAVLKGSTNRDHDFSGFLDKGDISDLALFLKAGIIDTDKFVDSEGTPVGGDLVAGRDFFWNNCSIMCHNSTGTAINFKSIEKPEFVATVANKNPWEFIHKVRAGQPGTGMSSGIINKWSEDNIRDLLSYSRTLPTEEPKLSWFDNILKAMGFREKNQRSFIPDQHRGFGPKVKRWTGKP
jgi:thiosulfate dehydrogenase